MDLTNINLFRDLSVEQLQNLQDKVIERTYPKNTVLFVEGEQSDGVYLIISGYIKIVKLAADGREKTLNILKSGEVIGEMALFQNELRTAMAIALVPSTVIVISKPDFEKLLFEVPELSIDLISILSHRLADANRQIEDLAFLNARSRVIKNLTHLARVYGKKHKEFIEIPLKLTHAELSNLVGITRENMTKTLNELQDLKIIEIVNRQIRISELSKLEKEIF